MPASSSDCQNLITCANLPPAFLIASPHTPITHAALCAPPKNGSCEILRASPQQRQQWLRWNPFDILCESSPDAAYRPVHRATGLAYQAYHFPCASVCRSCRVVHDVRSMALES